jgi:nitroreductase
MPDSTEQIEHMKHGPAQTGVDELILRRWSPRAYSEKPVSSENLTKVFTAAAWAASSSNEQPWRFLAGRKGDATYDKIFGCLVDANQSWAKAAPVLVLSVASASFARNGQPNYYALHDLGAASATLSLEATALGMHTHGMGGFDKDKAREVFAIPADHLIGAVWAIGYLGDPETLEERVKAMELAPRTRRPLSEIVFAEWGKPAAL